MSYARSAYLASVSYAICKSPFWEINTPLACIQRPVSTSDWWAFFYLLVLGYFYVVLVDLCIYACLMLHVFLVRHLAIS